MLLYINSGQHIFSLLEYMGVDNNNQKLALGTFNGIPSQFGKIITTLSWLDDDGSVCSLEIVKSLLLQKEQQKGIRFHNDLVGISQQEQPNVVWSW